VPEVAGHGPAGDRYADDRCEVDMTDQIDRTVLPIRLEEARKFAGGLASRLLVSAGEPR
jgi:hypothetical protein